ncbi:hypothetical protein Tco_0604470 [Tanacetum coccineum]
MSQDVLLSVMNSMYLIDEYVNVERKQNESCDKCFNLEAELLKSQNAYNNLLKRNSLIFLLRISQQAKAKQPLDKELDFACKHAQRIQELLVYVRDTCPNAINLSAKKVVVTPKNKVKKVRIEVLSRLYFGHMDSDVQKSHDREPTLRSHELC